MSFGKDSLAMVLYILEHGLPLDEVMFYDTGMEFEAIYRIRDKLLPILASRGIRYTELSPPVPFLYDMLERPVVSKQKGSHFGYGWCGVFAIPIIIIPHTARATPTRAGNRNS